MKFILIFPALSSFHFSIAAAGHEDVVVPRVGAAPAQGLASADRPPAAVLRPPQVSGQAVEKVLEGPHRHRLEKRQRKVEGDPLIRCQH